MAKVEVQYTKSYYKAVVKVVEIPDEISEDNQYEWLERNKLDLFEEEITSASLNLEDDEIEIL